MTIDTLTFFAAPLLAQAEGAPGGGAMMQFLILGLLFAGMWFLIIAPQRKKQKELEAMIKALKKGDQVVTTGGMFGRISGVRKDRFVITVAEGTKLEFAKNAVASVVKASASKDDDDEEELESEDTK